MRDTFRLSCILAMAVSGSATLIYYTEDKADQLAMWAEFKTE